jgi:hypothetical protein
VHDNSARNRVALLDLLLVVRDLPEIKSVPYVHSQDFQVLGRY